MSVVAAIRDMIAAGLTTEAALTIAEKFEAATTAQMSAMSAMSANVSASASARTKPAQTDERREKDRKRKAEKRAAEKAKSANVRADKSGMSAADIVDGAPASPPSPSPPRDINQPPLTPPTTPPPSSSLRSDSPASDGGDLFGGEPETPTGKKPKPDITASLIGPFTEFWNVYPRRTDKRTAMKAYDAAVRRNGRRVIPAILSGAQAYAEIRANQPPKFTKHPATWLNHECWNDETMVDPDAVTVERKVVISDRYSSHQIQMMARHNVTPATVSLARSVEPARTYDADAINGGRVGDFRDGAGPQRRLADSNGANAAFDGRVVAGSFGDIAQRARAGRS